VDGFPSSMVALGDSITAAYGSCLAPTACPRNSWATGDGTQVNSHYRRILASNPGRVYTRQMLLEALWGGYEYREPRTIDVHVRHLREKLEADPREPELIHTVRGVGYRFRDA